MTSHSETFIQKEKGKKLYCRYWNEDKKVESSVTYRGLVFIVHGLAEHCLYYTELAHALINNGYYVFAHDHVGHGQSTGDRVHVTQFSEYVTDVLDHIDTVRDRFPDLPVFIIGHSMGGTIAILAAMERPQAFKGVVLIGPLMQIDRKAASPFLVFMAKLLARIAPQTHVAKLDPKAVSRDEETVQRYEQDPLVYHGGVKCGTAVQFQHGIDKIQGRFEQITWPFYVLHGEKDTLCDVEGAKLLYEKAKSKDKKIKLFPDAFHQLHHEMPDVKKETLESITDWLKERS